MCSSMTKQGGVGRTSKAGDCRANTGGYASLAPTTHSGLHSPPVTMPTPTDGPPPGLRLGLVGGWLLNAAVGALISPFILGVPNSAGELASRLAALGFDTGQCLAAGIVSLALVWGWSLCRSRLPISPRLLDLLGLALLWVFASTLGQYLLLEDLLGPAERLAGDHGSTGVVRMGLISATCLLVPLAAFGGGLLNRARLRWVAVGLACGASVLNHFILDADYPGAHLLLSTVAATLSGTALAGAIPTPNRRWLVGLVLMIAAGVVAVVVPPGNRTRRLLDRLDGDALAPFILRMHETSGVKSYAPAPGEAEWFVPRNRAKHLPPTSPPLLTEPPIVILYAVDSLRADVLDRFPLELPELTRLRAESVDFSQARAPGSQTVYTLAEVMSGKYYSQQYWTSRKVEGVSWLWPHADKTPRFPEVLRKAGIETLTLTPAIWMVNEYGIVRGFKEETFVAPKKGEKYTAGAVVMTALIEKLKTHGEGPLFVFTHNLDPHAPYDRAGKGGTDFERYVREVALADREIGRLREALVSTGLWSRTVLIVTSDHGQAFGEHGTTTHGKTLYDELLRVPLLIRAPGSTARKITQSVSLMDLGPTVLDLMGQATPRHFMGQSLQPFLRGQDPALTRPICAEGRLKQAMLLPDGLKIMRDQRTGAVELYDLKQDPTELHDVFDSDDPEDQARLSRLHTFFDVHQIRKTGYVIPYRP